MIRTYGYKMFDATMSVWKQYEHDCYMHKIAPRPHEKFKYVRFLSINDAIVKIKNISTYDTTIARNSSNIDSASQNGTVGAGRFVELVYVDSTIGWVEI